jgi:hypothetical protein
MGGQKAWAEQQAARRRDGEQRLAAHQAIGDAPQRRGQQQRPDALASTVGRGSRADDQPQSDEDGNERVEAPGQEDVDQQAATQMPTEMTTGQRGWRAVRCGRGAGPVCCGFAHVYLYLWAVCNCP